MKFKLEINCDNAAFEENVGAELGSILEGLAGKLTGRGTASKFSRGAPCAGKVMDSNGNTVGKWTYEED